MTVLEGAVEGGVLVGEGERQWGVSVSGEWSQVDSDAWELGRQEHSTDRK